MLIIGRIRCPHLLSSSSSCLTCLIVNSDHKPVYAIFEVGQLDSVCNVASPTAANRAYVMPKISFSYISVCGLEAKRVGSHKERKKKKKTKKKVKLRQKRLAGGL